MADLPQEIIDALENIVEEKFNELMRTHKLNAEVTSADLTTFEEDQMLGFDGTEKIDQGFFRKFLRWLSNYINTIIANIEQMTFDSVRYVSPIDYDTPPDCGKIIAPIANLVITGVGVKPTVPDPATTTADDAGFDQESDLMEGGFAYNITDNLWYYRGDDTIYELKEALGLGVADISDFSSALSTILSDYVLKVAGKALSTNDLTDILKTAYDGAVSHAALTTVHIAADGTTIEVTGGNKLGVIASAVKSLFSGTAPIVKTDGAFSLGINTDQFEIVDNKLQIKASILGADGAKLSFNEGTNELSIDAGGTVTVDLSSLAAGGVDLSNYVKLTGAANQEIQGNLSTTGEMEAFS